MSPRAALRLEALGFAEVYDYVAGKADWGAAGLPREGKAAAIPTAADIADRSPPVCLLDEPLALVRERVQTAGWTTCIVINEDRVVFGLLGRAAITSTDDLDVESAMTDGPSTVRPNVPAEKLLERLARQQLTQAIVTTSDGRLVGVVRAESD